MSRLDAKKTVKKTALIYALDNGIDIYSIMEEVDTVAEMIVGRAYA